MKEQVTNYWKKRSLGDQPSLLDREDFSWLSQLLGYKRSMLKNFSILHNYASLRHFNALPHLVSFTKVTFLMLCPQVPTTTFFFFFFNQLEGGFWPTTAFLPGLTA